ncbi:MAG: Gfo/Idh/MocA family oxidoreductase [Acidobacteriota bacterium]
MSHQRPKPDVEPAESGALRMTRRRFLQWTAVAGAASAWGWPAVADSRRGIAIVGLGERGRATLTSWNFSSKAAGASVDGPPLVALCDRRGAPLAAAKVPPTVSLCRSLEETLELATVAGVVLAAPTKQQRELAQRALAAGRDVLLVRPAPPASVLEELESTARSAGRRLELTSGLRLSASGMPSETVAARLEVPSDASGDEVLAEGLEILLSWIGAEPGESPARLMAAGRRGGAAPDGAGDLELRAHLLFAPLGATATAPRRLDLKVRRRPGHILGRLSTASSGTLGLVPRAAGSGARGAMGASPREATALLTGSGGLSASRLLAARRLWSEVLVAAGL